MKCKKLVLELPIAGNDIGLSDLERFMSEYITQDVVGVAVEIASYVDVNDEQLSADGVTRNYTVSVEKFTATIVEYDDGEPE